MYAFCLGYFWLSCPLCRKRFGGHETGACLYTSWGHGESVCPECVGEADRINKETNYGAGKGKEAVVEVHGDGSYHWIIRRCEEDMGER